MISLVVVSHSLPLATAAKELAMQMTVAGSAPKVLVAAGISDGEQVELGTDAQQISEAITAADNPDGVLILVDLGSALLSSQMALEFLDPELADRCLISSGPLVEGLVAAVVSAAGGASLQEVASQAKEALAGKIDQLSDTEEPLPEGEGEFTDNAAEAASGEESFSAPEAATLALEIIDPHGMHARPAAALAAAMGAREIPVFARKAGTFRIVNAASLTQVSSLGIGKGETLELGTLDPQATEVFAAIRQALTQTDPPAIAGGSEKKAGSSVNAIAVQLAKEVPTPTDPTRNGDQIVIGYALVLEGHEDAEFYRVSPNEGQALEEARKAVRAYLRSLGSDSIIKMQIALVDDPELRAEIADEIAGGTNAFAAVDNAYSAAAAKMEKLDDPYLAERATDLLAVSRLLKKALIGGELDNLEELIKKHSTPAVLVVEELDAPLAASLPPEIEGVVTRSGGTTGHGAIVAASRGIPVYAGLKWGVHDGDTIVFDPRTKHLEVNPKARVFAHWIELARERVATATNALEQLENPAITANGKQIPIQVNVSGPTGAVKGAEGCGLVRTETLFAGYQGAPSRLQQAEVYAELARNLGQTTIRLWDIGADKPLPFAKQPPENNPFLGVRGVRLLRKFPHLLRDQLGAVLDANQTLESEGLGKLLRVMIPMVNHVHQVDWVRSLLEEITADTYGIEEAARPAQIPLPLGIMVETPSAALRMDEFCGVVDFISIGTNDLCQYVAAADRGNSQVADLADEVRETVVEMVRQIAQVCHDAAAPIEVCVCGDMASDPAWAGKLVAAGVDSLSVRAGMIAMIKQTIRQL